MNHLKHILVAFTLLFSGMSKAQSCSGDFSWLVNGLDVSFIGTTSPNVTNVVWDFGDGNYDYTGSQYTSHTYSSPGTYTACIIVYDSIQSCVDSTCHTFVLDSCYGYFTYSMNGLNGNFYGNTVGTTGNVVYQWNFGDNTTSSQQSPTHTFAQAGNYTVCFAYYDLSNGCSDSVCMPVSTGGCFADFTEIDSMGYAFFINQSSLGQSGYYTWDFGDGSPPDYSYNPSHVYPSPGTYQVCLTAYDSMQNFCDSTCHMVYITQVAGIENKIIAEQLSVSPNPASGQVNISFFMDENAEVNISLFDLEGREVQKILNKNLTAGPYTETINTAGIPSGTYFLRLQSKKQIVNAKLVIVQQL
ncbi:MAG TPA: PKD domain-containing protein [Bacteroidia bacterium]|jgi:PKD repeat protein|nr:PKD domain-containing protein [Bacteroidia bacterium]